MKIAVDAMGGDNAPQAVVAGAVQAARGGIGIILAGDESIVRAELAKYPDASSLPLEIRHASEVVDMHDSPATAYRRKKNSSIRVANELVKSGEASAVFSAGHSGAAMTTSLFVLGMVEGVERPAIATFMPTLAGTSIVLDVGANVDCKPQHLVQFGVMGDVYCRYYLKNPKPRIGLLSIGEEETKGNELTKEAFRMLRDTSLNFIGNVEGRDVMSGKADVIVCDGFVGNVVLKVAEGVAEATGQFLREEIRKSLVSKLGYLFMRPAFLALKRKVDYAEYGGAPLVGINGISIISHGRSSDMAIRNAIRVASELAASKITTHIREDIEKNMELVPAI